MNASCGDAGGGSSIHSVTVKQWLRAGNENSRIALSGPSERVSLLCERIKAAMDIVGEKLMIAVMHLRWRRPVIMKKRGTQGRSIFTEKMRFIMPVFHY